MGNIDEALNDPENRKNLEVLKEEEEKIKAIDNEDLSFFQRLADKVSYGMGTPTNIIIWLILVITWICLGPYFAHHTFLPNWFTSNGFNFPLNTVTTIAELYIGFLVGASSNRSERHLQNTLTKLQLTEDILSVAIQENTDLTNQIHEQTLQIEELNKNMAALTKLLQKRKRFF